MVPGVLAVLAVVVWSMSLTGTMAWKSTECPIDSQDNRETYLCIRPCDYEELPGPTSSPSVGLPSRNQHGRSSAAATGAGATVGADENFFVVFFPPNRHHQYERGRFKCPPGFRQSTEPQDRQQCFCERPYTPYELEMQRREKCDQAFERCRMYGAKPYDCNHIIDACPGSLIREYCLAGKVFKMRFARVLYEFCHAFLRLPDDGRRHFLEPNIDRKKQ